MARKRSTQQEVEKLQSQIADYWEAGLTTVQIADAVGKSKGCITYHLRSMDMQGQRLSGHPRVDSETKRLVQNLRNRVKSALRRGSASKDTSIGELLGCSADVAKQYITSLLSEGMTWDNYGLYGWHIDHIRPCASFDLTDPEQQRQCFHYTNLQPLWAADNLAKSEKWEAVAA